MENRQGLCHDYAGSGLPGLDHAEAIAKLETDGTVILNSGGADLGTGLDTISAKIVAEVLKLPMDRITVVSGDTDSCAFDTGAYASSGIFFSGQRFSGWLLRS